MSHTYAHNLVHCVFSTKNRASLIKHPDELGRYIAGLAYAKGMHIVAAGGTDNHLHLLILLPQTITLAKAMQDLKANTSRWLRETCHAFEWQQGYGAFSVSQSQRETVAHYIATQEDIIERGRSRKNLRRYCRNRGSNTTLSMCSGEAYAVPTATQHSAFRSVLG